MITSTDCSPARVSIRSITSPTAAPPKIKPGAIAVTSESVLFDGIDTWPSLNQALRDRALKLLQEGGLDTWKLRGGILDAEGQPTLGGPSSEALEALRHFIQESKRFSYQDTAGVTWAVLITEESHQAWRGLGLGVTGSLDVLAYGTRVRILQRLSKLIDVQKRAEAADESCRRTRAHLSHLHRRLTSLEAATKLISHLYMTARTVSPCMKIDVRTLADAVWGEWEPSRPDEWKTLIVEALAMLSNLELQIVRIPKVGWRPEPVARQPASLGVCWLDSATLEIRWTNMFLDFLDEWLAPGKPLAARLNRHPIRLFARQDSEDD